VKNKDQVKSVAQEKEGLLDVTFDWYALSLSNVGK
jgi:hypothetical protein